MGIIICILVRYYQDINPSANICLPIIHKWEGDPRINNMVIISHPEDAERICKLHLKKAPNLKSLLDTSIISTTDNEDWSQQRSDMNPSFLPKTSLQSIFHISQERAQHCTNLLRMMSDNYKTSVNMSDFFLNEAQAQLQLAMFGFSDEFEKDN